MWKKSENSGGLCENIWLFLQNGYIIITFWKTFIIFAVLSININSYEVSQYKEGVSGLAGFVAVVGEG